MASWHCSSVRTSLEGKQTEPNRTEINRFEPVFGSVQKLKKTVWLFIFVQNRTEPKMLSPSCRLLVHLEKTTSTPKQMAKQCLPFLLLLQVWLHLADARSTVKFLPGFKGPLPFHLDAYRLMDIFLLLTGQMTTMSAKHSMCERYEIENSRQNFN
jgi:hypothetical protein